MSATDATPPGAASPEAVIAQCRQALVSGDFGAVFALADHIAGLPELPDAVRAQVWVQAAMAAWNTLQPALGRTWAERAGQLARQTQDQAMLAQALALQGACLALEQRVPEAVSALRDAVATVREDMPVATRRTVHTAVAVIYRQLGLSRLELAAARRAVDTLGAGDPAGSIVRSWANLANAAEEHWRDISPLDPAAGGKLLDEVLAQLPRLDALAGDNGHAQVTLDAVFGGLLLAADRTLEARQRLRRALEGSTALYPSGDDWQVSLALLVGLGRCEQALGDTQAAAIAVQRAQALLDAHRGDTLWPWLMRRVAELAVLAGDASAAAQWSARYHANVVRNEQAAVDAEVAALAVSVNQHVLRGQVQQWQDLAHRDALTGLLNRRAIEQEYAAAAERGAVLAMLDIDHFKRINDTYGHPCGDRVLRELALLLGSTVRQLDRVARYGGEEFMLLLVGVDTHGAQAFASRLQHKVRRHDWAALGEGIAVTVSGGMVVVQAHETIEAAAARADSLLYRAKHEGRDRILIEQRPLP